MRKVLLSLLGAIFACTAYGAVPARADAVDGVGAPVSLARSAMLAGARTCGLCADDACALGSGADAPGRIKNATLYRAPPEILQAIDAASTLADVNFDYMLRAAALESSFNPGTEVQTSSAVGLYQFVEQTWFHMLAEIGAELGLEDLAGAIVAGENGYEVADADARAEILRLRYQPDLSALMAGLFTRRNAAQLTKALGRAPEASELYVAHVMGATGGAELIRLAAEEPQAKASKHFARAARANRSIFFDGKRPRTAAEVIALLGNKYLNIQVYAADHAPWISAPLPEWNPPLTGRHVLSGEFL